MLHRPTDRIKPYITGSYAPSRACEHALPVNGSKMGVFDHIFAALVVESGPPDRLMIPSCDFTITCRAMDATHLEAHRMACSLLKGGGCSPRYRPYQRRAEHQVERGLRRPGPSSAALVDRGPAIRPQRRRNIAAGLASCAHTFLSASQIAAIVIFWINQ